MERSAILERLYELHRDIPDKEEMTTKLIYDVLHNNISLSDAEIKLRSIDPNYTRYEFLQNLKGKPIFKNIIEYKKGNLDLVQVAKIISSLVTQVLIQKEQNPDVDPKALQMDMLLDLLNQYSNESEIDFNKFDALLDNYGWNNKEE